MFCKCGTLIHFPQLVSEEVKCRRCSAAIEDSKPVLISATKKFCKKEEHVQAEVKGARIKMKCPKCGAEGMLYNTAQLRSADEGQTVFYSCDSCGYRETVNS